MTSALILAVILPSAVFAAKTENLGPMSVKVKTTKVRVEPKVWAGAVVALKYGDSVETVSVTDGWFKVKTGAGKSGYLHESALTSKRVVLAARGSMGDGMSERSDVVLAGKGFNKAVEREFAEQDRSLNFKAVDAMERMTINDRDLAAFMKAGRLGGKG
jgi:uncharacterized membrane protein